MSETEAWQGLRKTRISRRTLLRRSAGASVGVAGLALVGCSGTDEEIAELQDDISELAALLDETLEALVGEEAPTETPPADEPEAPAPPPPVGYPRVRVGSLAELGEGAAVQFEYPLRRQPNILMKLGRPAAGGIGPDGDVVAFSELCTHMGCPIGTLFQPDHGTLGPCVCHFTTFDLTHRGMVVIGQATENLPQVILELDGDDIFAVGMSGIIYGYRDNLADGELAGERT